MSLKFVLIISAVILASLLVDVVKGARRGNSGRRRGGGRRDEARGARYQWTRELGSGSTAREEASAITERHLIFVKSNDNNMSAAGFTKSATLYDFSTIPPIFVITILERSRRGPCYVANTTLTFEGVNEMLTNRNGLSAPLGSQTSLDGSGNELTPENVQALLATNPALRRVCKQGKIVTTATAAVTSDSTKVIKVLTVDSELSLTVPTLPQRSRNGSSRRGNRGEGGRANRRRGQN